MLLVDLIKEDTNAEVDDNAMDTSSNAEDKKCQETSAAGTSQS